MEKKHATKCNINSNVGVPKVQKDESHCTCDGYHTFDELYEHRITLYIALCRTLSRASNNSLIHRGEWTKIWRSKLHSDGTSFDGWFVLGIGKEQGSQITYHLPNEKWGSVDFVETLNRAPEFDGHTSEQVLARVAAL